MFDLAGALAKFKKAFNDKKIGESTSPITSINAGVAEDDLTKSRTFDAMQACREEIQVHAVIPINRLRINGGARGLSHQKSATNYQAQYRNRQKEWNSRGSLGITPQARPRTKQ